ncbi:MAG: lipopolysaccharide transport system permease protein [Chthoniobacter sp.]|jgi:lipopolysaccharide transport system permease protein|nr:lipopolysaccharide transport system permease protein [Chthoniobacter sp.]
MTASSSYQLVIRPNRNWLRIDFQSIWEYRDLLLLLVRRDFVSKYKQTVLGPAWFVLQPLLTTLVFTVIFGGLARLSTDGVPPVLFYLCGLTAWSYFAQSVSSTSSTFASNAHLFGKVYFPRLIVPLSAVLSNLLAFGIQFGTFVAAYAYFKCCTATGGSFGPRPEVFLLPLLVAQIAMLSLGVGLWMSALTAKYRDFAHLSAFLLQLWMYATPVIYPLSIVPKSWRWVAVLNPMTVPVESFKILCLGSGSLSPAQIGLSMAVTLVVLLTGLLAFQNVERTFVDSV